MNYEHPFVGRTAELDRFMEVLADPRGQAILVVGPQGMGKSWLVKRMGQTARHHPSIKSGCVQYDVRDQQTADAVLEDILSDADAAANTKLGLLKTESRRIQLWAGMLELGGLGGWRTVSEAIAPQQRKRTPDEFLEKLDKVSRLIPENARGLFILDSDKYMLAGSDSTWAYIVKNLPAKFKLLFAQRPDDMLAGSHEFRRLKNVVSIPDVKLGRLESGAVDKLAEHRSPRLDEAIVRRVFEQYDGHPYAVQAGLDLITEGLTINALPVDPTHPEFGIAAEQWQRVGERGEEAMRIFKALTILEIPVPDDVLAAVADVSSDTVERICAVDRYVSGLIESVLGTRRIYHSILSDYVATRIPRAEAEAYHHRAIELFRAQLHEAKRTGTAPASLAAERLARHVQTVDTVQAVLLCFVNECTSALNQIGKFDTIVAISEQLLPLFEPDSMECAALYGNLGIVLQTRGDLEGAEAMYRKAQSIDEKVGQLDGMADQYGNLGVVLKTRGDLEGAEAMLRKSLAINEKLGRLEGMARNYGNLGVVLEASGDLEGAEAIHRKSLAINEKLGRLEGMARNYGNLGLVLQTRGDLEGAETMFRKSLAINEKLGRLEGMAIQYGNLGNMLTRGDLQGAEAMYNKSLAINEKLGRLEGMAIQYGSLGIVLKKRGNLSGARELWTKARDLFERIGMPHMVRKVQGWIDDLDKKPESE